MNFLLAVSSAVVCSLFVPCTSEGEKKFVVFADHFEASQFYPEIIRESTAVHIGTDEFDFNRRKQICEDVLSNHEFRRKYQHPYQQEANSKWFCFSSSPFNYPIRSIRVSPFYDDRRITETVILCLAYGLDKEIYRYYISGEYNIGTPENYLAGRFIFYKDRSRSPPRLYGMAESPGEVYTGPDHDDVERLFLARRKLYGAQNEYQTGNGDYTPSLSASSSGEDALCKLTKEEKTRVCNAVFKTSYFAEEMAISINHFGVDPSCGLQVVSFQTAYGIANKGQKIGEWMLKCSPNWRYLLGHAYRADQILVYIRQREAGEVFPEKVIDKVRLKFPDFAFGSPFH